MIQSYRYRDLSDRERSGLLQRPASDTGAALETVRPIIEAVRKDGDLAVQNYTRTFDGVTADPYWITPDMIRVDLPNTEKQALDRAIRNVELFHTHQRRGTLQVETSPGVLCMRESRPIESVGLYIPGGLAPLPSTAIMLGVPARVAGCRTLVMATPPDRNGQVPPSILYVAKQIGVTGLLVAGGAQAIAAMGCGTDTVPKVDKIFGPGNSYVTAAKLALQSGSANITIDMPAGPSEVLVIVDSLADPEFVAVDLLSQAEHGPDSQVVLLTLPGVDTNAIQQELERQLNELPRNKIARKALESSYLMKCDSMEQALDFSNAYAPEHLILNVESADRWTDQIEHAGSVFLGPWTPESLGDYASGTNHTLPTYGYARSLSGVSLESFQKQITFQSATPDGLRELGPTVETLAGMEGLDAHRLAVTRRLNRLDDSTAKKNSKST
ncbi:MAG: histidinol dehydrogenase [Bacteroidota bacterium]